MRDLTPLRHLLFPRLRSRRHTSKATPPSTTMTTPPPPPATPRPAASLLLLTATNRVLLLHRPRTSRSFPNAHVFPGGVAARADASPRMTALRETFEETGLLLTTTAPPASLDLGATQSAVHSNAAIFEERIASAGLRLVDATLLTPATTWITPQIYPRRFESRFFIASLPEWMSEREAEEVARRGDGGKEVVSALFVTPRRALAMAAADEVVFFPPQFYLLSVLARFLSDSSGDRASEERKKLREWADMGWGSLVCQPRGMKVGKTWVLTLGDNGDREWAIVLEHGGAGEPKAVRLVRREEAFAKI